MIRAEALFAPKPERSSIDAPLDHLKACHRRIEERLDLMERAAAHLETNRAEALDAFASAFRFMDTAGVLHTEDEEMSVFPRLKAHLERGELSYLAGLEHDHTEAHRLYTELKQIHAEAPAPKVAAVVARLTTLYRAHIASEDDVLQAYGAQHLAPADLGAIAAEMKARRGQGS